MAKGWVKIHREFIETRLYEELTTEQIVITLHILLKANHQKKSWTYEGVEYSLLPGQLVTSLKSLHSTINKKDITINKIRTCLKKLEKYGFITNESTNKNRLITVINWATYQSDTDNDTNTSQSDNNVSTYISQEDNKDLTTNKKVRMKEGKNERREEDIYIYGDDVQFPNNITSKLSKFTLTSQQIQQVIDSWNAIEGLAEIKSLKLDTKRGRMLYARCKEYGIEEVIAAIDSINQSSFLKGMKTSWRATFDWVVKPNNFIKVMEGQYIDKKGDNNVYNNGRSAENDREQGQTYCERYGIADTEVPF